MKIILRILFLLFLGALPLGAQTVTAIPALTTIATALADGDLMPIHDLGVGGTNIRKVALSVLKTYFQTGAGDVTAASAYGTDNRLIRSDGTGKGTQSTGITVDDSDNISGVAELGVTGPATVGSMQFEGATADANETALAVTDPTADRTITLPDATGTVALTTSVDTTQTGVHATPSTSNPLAPTWTGPTHLVWYGATGEIDLPAAAGYAGRGLILYNTGAFTVTFDPNASEVIVRDGTVQTGGVSFTLSSGAGNYVALVSDGARWITLGFKGTLSVGS